MRRTTPSLLVLGLVLVALAGAGCGSAEEVLTSPSIVTAPPSASTSADVPADATTTTDFAPSPSTAEQTPTSTDATDTSVPADPSGAVFAVVAGDLVELDPLTGNVARVVIPQFSGDGVFRVLSSSRSIAVGSTSPRATRTPGTRATRLAAVSAWST